MGIENIRLTEGILKNPVPSDRGMEFIHLQSLLWLLFLLCIQTGCAEFSVVEEPIDSTASNPKQPLPEVASDNESSQADTRSELPEESTAQTTTQTESSSEETIQSVDDDEPEPFKLAESCNTNLDCGGENAVCIKSLDEQLDQSLPNGYCTIRQCESDATCLQDGECRRVDGMATSICLAVCESDIDCRDGYNCINDTCWALPPEPEFDPQRPLIRGSVSYDFYEIQVTYGNGGHFERIPEQPAAGLLALLKDGNNDTLANAVLDEEGQYSFQLDHPLAGDETVLLIPAVFDTATDYVPIIVADPNDNVGIDNVRGEVWAWRLNVPDDGNLGRVNVTREQGAGAIYIFQLLAETMANFSVEQDTGALSDMPSLVIWWDPNKEWSCGACYVHNSQPLGNGYLDSGIFITGNNLGGAWGTPVLLHEFGHYITRHFSRDDSRGGPHYLGEPSPPALAMSEGFASFNALRNLSRFAGEPVSQYTFFQDDFAYTIEYGVDRNTGEGIAFPNPNGRLSNNIDEQAVTVALWQLFDGSEVAEDSINDGVSLSFSDIMNAMRSSRYFYGNRGANGTDLADLLDSLYCEDIGTWDDILTLAQSSIGLPYTTPSNCN